MKDIQYRCRRCGHRWFIAAPTYYPLRPTCPYCGGNHPQTMQPATERQAA